jgi:hypothetical protein
MRRWLMAVVGLGTMVAGAAAQIPAVPPPPTAMSAPGALKAPASLPAEMIIIAQPGVEVRSGPTTQYYPTSKLRFGDKVLVLRESEAQKDWYAIRPPAGSFSWINGKYLRVAPHDPRIAVVDVQGGGTAPVLPGSSVVDKEPNHESTRIASGSLVTIVDRPNEVAGEKWYAIAPPPSEARFIPKDAVMPPQTTSVTPQGWARKPDSFSPPPAPKNSTPQGQLIGTQVTPPVGTPASYSQQANPWTPHNGVATQPPQWSSWGKLRRTSFPDKDGQPMYVAITSIRRYACTARSPIAATATSARTTWWRATWRRPDPQNPIYRT